MLQYPDAQNLSSREPLQHRLFWSGYGGSMSFTMCPQTQEGSLSEMFIQKICS